MLKAERNKNGNYRRFSREKTARRQSIDEVGGKLEIRWCRVTESTIYHKGKSMERLSTARTTGDILVKNSRQGQLNWEQKWWMRYSQQATNLDSPSLLLQEKESICLSFISSWRQWLHLGPNRGLKLNIKALFPLQNLKVTAFHVLSKNKRERVRTGNNKGSFQTSICKATTAKGIRIYILDLFFCAIDLKKHLIRSTEVKHKCRFLLMTVYNANPAIYVSEKQ